MIKKFICAILLSCLAHSASAAVGTVYAMGDSWLAGQYNPYANYDLGLPMGVKAVSNYALNSQTTALLKEQIDYIFPVGGNTNWGSNATVVIDIGLPDFMGGTPRATTQENLFQIVDKLTARGIKVILSGAPDADVPGDLFLLPLEIDPLYAAVKAHNPAVTILDIQSKFMKIPQLRYSTNSANHLNLPGYKLVNKVLGQNIRVLNGIQPVHASPADMANWFLNNLPGLSWPDECVIRTLIMEPGNGC
jgi:hypothetical protein